ncbi:MAG: FKBP-type peptidyl-prolyl cis-trans isomerase [Limnoraphis sp. WC205]|jgi:peptidylprolyl isomerase|nr:FKBP-type peptidyl-prolyl cis-trans isomerase [Limnoraphis sp. WC205]
MSQAKVGSKVKIHYMGKLENGEVFSSSTNNEPLEFCVGEGKVLSNLEEAIVGMSPGESKTITVPAKQAFDSPDRESTLVVNRETIPEDLSIEVGQEVYIRVPDTHASIPALVQEMSAADVVLSVNHSLENENRIFEIQLIEVG